MDTTKFVFFLQVLLSMELAAGTSVADGTPIPDNSTVLTSNQTLNINRTSTVNHVEAIVETVPSNESTNIGIIIPDDTNANTCGELFFSESGGFSSPNYPDLYPINILCEWKIFAPEGHVIKVSFDAFQVESSTNCIHDSVAIIDNKDLRQILCGTSIPSPVESRTNIVTVSFYSDDVVTLSGFLARYVVIAPVTTTQKSITNSANIGDVSSETMTILLVLIGVVLLAAIGLIAGILFYKITKDKVKHLQKKKRVRKKGKVVNQHLAPPPPIPSAYLVKRPPVLHTYNYQTRPDMTQVYMT